MKEVATFGLGCFFLWGCVALAAGPGQLAPLDPLTVALKSDIPQPASVIPPTEMTGGTVGTGGTYRPADARTPRITRSKTVTLDATGTATFDWAAQGALATPVQVVTTAVYSGTGVPKCWATSISSTAVSVKCVVENNTLLNLAAVTAGINLNGGSASGLQVGVIALPPS